MRVTDARPNVAPRVDQSDSGKLSPDQVGALFSGVDLGWLPSSSDVCSLLGRAANALAALFGGDSNAGSIVDFGQPKADPPKSIVDFGDRGSIVDFGDRADDVVS